MSDVPHSNHDLAAIEARIVATAMARWETWKDQHPEGLLPYGTPGAMFDRQSHELAAACRDYEQARSAATPLTENNREELL